MDKRPSNITSSNIKDNSDNKEHHSVLGEEPLDFSVKKDKETKPEKSNTSAKIAEDIENRIHRTPVKQYLKNMIYKQEIKSESDEHDSQDQTTQDDASDSSVNYTTSDENEETQLPYQVSILRVPSSIYSGIPLNLSRNMPMSRPNHANRRPRSNRGGVPDKEKDARYWERRRKNNEAARRSRDARRAKEDEIAIRAAMLEQENLRLRVEVAALKNDIEKLRYMLKNE